MSVEETAWGCLGYHGYLGNPQRASQARGESSMITGDTHAKAIDPRQLGRHFRRSQRPRTKSGEPASIVTPFVQCFLTC
jgi:hypothetical protein